MSEETANRNNKDRLFKFIFGREENKAWTLSLYNAINGSNYENPEDIQINSIDDVMFLGMKNDVSFIISETMNIYEQQSSFCPNMPMRQFIYAGRLYDKYIELNHIYIYSTNLKKFPAPKLICFYNGEKDRPEREVLRLADAFEGNAEADISVNVTMININYGKNEKLMEACHILREYSWLVEEIRKNRKEKGLDLAVEDAIKSLDTDAHLKPFLMGHLAEVKTMCLREYSEEEIKEMFKNDGIEEGRKEGLEEGRKEGLTEGLKEGTTKTMTSNVKKIMEKLGMSVEQAMDILEIPEEERKTVRDAI